MSKLYCRNCGDAVCDEKDARRRASKMYRLTESSAIRVWHNDCAIADGRIDSEDDFDGPYYWEVR